MKLLETILVVGLLSFTATGAAAQEKPKVPLRQFTALEVETFENATTGTKDPFPDEWLPILREQIMVTAIGLCRFRWVTEFRDIRVPPPHCLAPAPPLRSRLRAAPPASAGLRLACGRV